MTMTIQQEELLSKLAIAYYKQQKELNIQVYLGKRAEESGDDRGQEFYKGERRIQLAKMEAIIELAEDNGLSAYQIEKEVMVIQEHEQQIQAIVKQNIANHEESIKQLGFSE